MLRPPVLMRSIREGQRSIRKNFRRFSSKRRKVLQRPLTRFKSLSVDDSEFVLTIKIDERSMINKMDESVFYKDDESRFKNRYTLKLRTFSDYIISLEVKPILQIAYIKFGGFKYEDPKATSIDSNDPKSLYRFNWSADNISITERKFRTIVPCIIKFRGYKELTFKLSVKFYSNEESAHFNGIPFSSLSLDGVLVNHKYPGEPMFHVIFN